MRRRSISLALALALALLLTIGSAAASSTGTLTVDGRAIETDAAPRVVNGSTYVSLRSVTEALRADASVSWEGMAVVRAPGLDVRAQPGSTYIEANGRALYVRDAVRVDGGRTMVPVRVLADAMDASVQWDPSTGDIAISSGSGAIAPATDHYNADDLYWLSRIISAESRGEPFDGKVAVGNVVLNRVNSGEFPNSVYGVIFDARWGGQFEPVRNGTIYQEPTAESVLAAKLCLEGADVAGGSLYFLAPAIASNTWIMQNRPYVKTIGNHWFYR